ncbi:MAG: ABC transporter ATP-binding protein [Candidatus Promineifilaceae bacterium]|nr:ABC transporter ATP-binding protein [Candidatus Promineifilaceae bacterium]
MRKSFGDVVALKDVSLAVNRREIHGLLGGNGAGKTTLMNILYGLYEPDAGEIVVDGKAIEIDSPRDAITHGIGMVHQHFLQVDSFTVTENVVLGSSVENPFALNLEQAAQRIEELSRQFGLEVPPDAVVGALSMGVRQRVEILKALYRGVDILILDEPTTNLTPQQVEDLFRSLRVMVEKGLSVIFITHKLREVLAACDRVSVLRHGQKVLTVDREEVTPEALVQAMVGDELDVEESLLFSDRSDTLAGRARTQAVAHPLVSVDALSVVADEGHVLLDNCTFDICDGEIFGVAGIAGNGQQVLAEALMGLKPVSSGKIAIAGESVTDCETRELLAMGVSYVPENRLSDGFLPRANVAQNLILGMQRRPPYSRGLFLDWKQVFAEAQTLIRRFNIKTQGPEEMGANLSGGNIQRVMLARAFAHPSRFLIVHNPTQGLDIPSAEFVYSLLLERKKEGAATLLISEDEDELFLLCDRIAVIYQGEIVGILERAEFDPYQLGKMMTGVRAGE